MGNTRLAASSSTQTGGSLSGTTGAQEILGCALNEALGPCCHEIISHKLAGKGHEGTTKNFGATRTLVGTICVVERTPGRSHQTNGFGPQPTPGLAFEAGPGAL